MKNNRLTLVRTQDLDVGSFTRGTTNASIDSGKQQTKATLNQKEQHKSKMS